MKKIFAIILPIVALLTACKTDSPYITTGCDLSFEVTGLMGTQMTVRVTPEDDRAFYYFNIVPAETFKNYDLKDEHYMTLMLDSLYRDYLDWRALHLWNKEDYVTDFRSYAFSYGVAERYYVTLQPNTEYLIYGFCINPDDIQLPVGKLYKHYVRTTEVDMSVSPMVIDFKVLMLEEPSTYQNMEADLIITTRPSIIDSLGNAHPTKEPYFYACTTQKELDENYGGSLFALAAERAVTLQDILHDFPDRASTILSHDIKGYGIMSQWADIEPGDEVIALAAAYRSTWYKALYTFRFKYEPGKEIPYQHDPLVDYTPYVNDQHPAE